MSNALEPDRLQRNALHELHQHTGARALVVMPCGSGKTLVGRWFAEQTLARVTVVFVPSLALVPQTLLAYRSDLSWQHTSMIVCSDESTGQAVSVADLDLPVWARTSVTASTSARDIGEFLTSTAGARVIVSTYHSAPRVAAALRATGLAADLVVCDEAHRLAGRPRREFRAVLDQHLLPARRRLFLTATPVETAAWAADNGETVDAPLSLEDEETFGPSVYRATFADAVAAGRLVDYDVQVLTTPRADERGGPVEAVLTAARDGASRILTFHSRVTSARRLAEALDGVPLPDGRTIVAEHLEARHRARRRERALGRLADPGPQRVSVIASARVLTEGVDVPAVDTVVFAEPRTSPVDIVQAVGRAMRRAPGKGRGRIVLAVALPASAPDEDTALSSTAWRHVWITLRALAAMDPRFATRLRTRLHGGGHGGYQPRPDGTRRGPELMLDLPSWVDLDQWRLRALDRTGGSWWRRYDLLADHTREHGTARPGAETRRGGIALGRWVVAQRTAYRQGTLEPDRVEALQKLPGWAWSARETAWWRAAEVWTRVHSRRPPTGDDRWPALADTPAWGIDPPKHAYDTLAEFAVDTCSKARRGELPAHLHRAADRLPAWDWDIVAAGDAAMVDTLADYGEWNKDLNPPHDYRHDDGQPLGAWVTAVRRRRYTGRLNPALETELQLLGRPVEIAALRWDAGETAWRLGYLALRQFVVREGTARIPYQHAEALPDHELNLSRWCVVQRQQHRRNELDPARVSALEQVPGWEWEVSLREGYRPVLEDAAHGKRASYAKGCRCNPCTAANAQFENERQNGQQTDLVDVAPVRTHLRALLAKGAKRDAIRRVADLSDKTVDNAIDNVRDRIRPENAAALLAVTLEQALAEDRSSFGPHGELIDAGPTWALIDWMVMRGWPKAWISREIGQDGRALQLGPDRVSRANAEKVAELDRRLGRTRRPPRRGSNRNGTKGSLRTLDELLAADEAAS